MGLFSKKEKEEPKNILKDDNEIPISVVERSLPYNLPTKEDYDNMKKYSVTVKVVFNNVESAKDFVNKIDDYKVDEVIEISIQQQ